MRIFERSREFNESVLFWFRVLARIRRGPVDAVLFLRRFQNDRQCLLFLIDIDVLAVRLKVLRYHLDPNGALGNRREMGDAFHIGPYFPMLSLTLAEFEHLPVRSEKIENDSGPLDWLSPRIFHFNAYLCSRSGGKSWRKRSDHKKQKRPGPEHTRIISYAHGVAGLSESVRSGSEVTGPAANGSNLHRSC